MSHAEFRFSTDSISFAVSIYRKGRFGSVNVGGSGCIESSVRITKDDDIFFRHSQFFQCFLGFPDTGFRQIASIPIGRKNDNPPEALFSGSVNCSSGYIDFIIFMRNKDKNRIPQEKFPVRKGRIRDAAS
ncbi:MAG: hypothetical protein VZT47_05020 [Dialister sp.]|nr:hypothetical protein [Dialister sp.]MEE3452894.1 hypothetical protein [Dialister sp.]